MSVLLTKVHNAFDTRPRGCVLFADIVDSLRYDLWKRKLCSIVSVATRDLLRIKVRRIIGKCCDSAAGLLGYRLLHHTMFLRHSFSILSLLMFSSSSSAVYRGIFSQTCYRYISRGSPRYRAQGVCINDCAAIYMAGKPSTLTRGDERNQDGGCTGGINGQTPCKVGASVFGAPGTSCDEYPFASTREGAASGNPSILRCIPAEENSSGGQQLTQFYTRQGVQPGDTFDVGFVWGQPVYNSAGIQTGTNPAVPPAAVQMCYAHPTQRVNDGREFRMVLTTQLWRRATSVFRRKTAELQEITAERKSTVAEPLWVKTANNLTMMVYSDVKLGSPVWSDGEDGKDKVVRIIKPSDSDYPPKQSTKKTTGNESSGMQSKKPTDGKSTKTAGATPMSGPVESTATKGKLTTNTKSIAQATKGATGRESLE